MRRRLFPAVPVVLAASLLAAACGGSDSIQDAGNTSAPPQTTSPDTDGSDNGDSDTDGSEPADTTTVAPATTVATGLEELPECPVDALTDATGPVNVTFWHGMTGDLEAPLKALVDEYNASQPTVRVTLQNQGGYEQALDKYLQSGQGSRPEMLQSPEYALQVLRDDESFIPVEACMAADEFDTSTLLPATTNAYTTEGVQWSMPFNVSNPVLYYNKKVFEAAGLDPEVGPRSLEDLREFSQAIVDSGAASFGLAIDTNFDSGGGWFIEQWFAKAGVFYSDNENGRSARATQVLFDNETGAELYGFLQALVNDGLAVNVGENASGQDTFLKIADTAQPAAMTIGTSAALGTVVAGVSVIAPQIGDEGIGVAPMPGPDGAIDVLVGGASLWIVKDKGDVQAAAVWDFIKFLLTAQAQSTWAAATGYVPVNEAAVELDPLATTYRDDPRFRVAYDSLLNTSDAPTSVGPVLGPQREIRGLTSRALASVFQGADPAEALASAARDANSLIEQYNLLIGS
jgi:sn-glycerol 3-phosphate transport system substrate-binding protein